jgi:hypothetical protein
VGESKAVNVPIVGDDGNAPNLGPRPAICQCLCCGHDIENLRSKEKYDRMRPCMIKDFRRACETNALQG